MDSVTWFSIVRKFGAFAFFVGLCFGVLYGVGGFFVDLFTTGLNQGTALALLAVPMMPFLALPIGLVGGALWAPLYVRIPESWGGGKEPPGSTP